jgi:hypothetical protein
MQEDDMRTIINSLTVLFAWVVPALAANGSGAHGDSILLHLFLGFGVVIVAFKLYPGILQFAAMAKELFTPTTKQVSATMHGTIRKS